jgi:3'-phosphoadenosine 5'-phosphosulfate sulfotransferase (PAPS reductase)/FAD synthetase
MVEENPYHIEGPALISFSGGRTSAYMLWHILEAHGGTLPDDVHVCFANTGKEREETLRFVHECATRWGVWVRWLEFRDRRVSLPITERFAEVGYNSASRAGEPFAALIASKGYTPNAVMRWCTQELKVRVLKWFMQSLSYSNWINIVGLRYDEPTRVARSRRPNKECWTNALPLADAKVTNRAVRAWWARQPFDLQLLPFEGNCDACFLKARPKLWEVERTKPGTLQWWADQEAELDRRADVKCASNRFVTEYSYAELIRDVRRQPDMFAGGLFDNDPDMDAECGLWCAGEAA